MRYNLTAFLSKSARIATTLSIAFVCGVASHNANAVIIEGTMTGRLTTFDNNPLNLTNNTLVTMQFTFDTTRITTTNYYDYSFGNEYGFFSSNAMIGYGWTAGSSTYTAPPNQNMTMYHSIMPWGHTNTVASSDGTVVNNFRLDPRFTNSPFNPSNQNDPTFEIDASLIAGTLSSESTFGIAWGGESASGYIDSYRLVALNSENTGNNVPEPASLLLVSLGLAGLMSSRRRRVS